MTEYDFVRIGLNRGILYSEPEADYKEIIRQKSDEGWEFVQIFAPSVAGEGVATFFELIFKRAPLDE